MPQVRFLSSAPMKDYRVVRGRDGISYVIVDFSMEALDKFLGCKIGGNDD